MPKNLNYPLASFQKAFALADAVDALGGSCWIEIGAAKMQRKVSGGFMVIVSSAQKFNLINSEKSFITITEEYKLIKHSYTNSERMAFLKKAFLTPQVFSILFERFKGQELPVEMLDKILIREFGVEENTAGRVAGYFTDGLKAYGLLIGNRLADDDVQEKAIPIEEAVKIEPASETIPNHSKKETIPDPLDASFTHINSERYEVQLTGPNISTKLNLDDEEDVLILEAIVKKIRKKLTVK